MKRFCLKLCMFACLWVTWPVLAGADGSFPYEVIDKGALSGAQQNKAMLHTIRDQTSWEAFWSKHQTITPKTSPKPVDFNKKEVIAIVDSDQPNSGYKLILDHIEQHNDELWVYVIREQPQPSCLNLGMVSQPFVIIAIDKFSGPAKLVFNTRMVAC